MSDLKHILSEKIPQWRSEQQELLTQYGDRTISEVSIARLFRGMRGVNAVVCDTSYVDAQEGLFIRSIPVIDLVDRQIEEIVFLLFTGELPGARELAALHEELMQRAGVPGSVRKVLDALPEGLHPMTQLSIATLAMRNESRLDRAIADGTSKNALWEAMLEDALNIMARLPVIAADIYRRMRGKTSLQNSRQKAGYITRFADLLELPGNGPGFQEFLRQFFIVHCDHEGANASVLASRVVHSTQSDLYYSLSAAMNCLAGPLHGLANQTSVKFGLEIQKHFNGVPTADALGEWIWQHLQKGQVIPGFGHAVLRNTDPRYQVMLDLGQKACPENELFRITKLLGEVVPPLLIRQGKAKSPHPNIDGISGTLLYSFGMTELPFYTVMFSVAQTLGICAQLTLNRAMMAPIFRPRSVTTRHLQTLVAPNSAKI